MMKHSVLTFFFLLTGLFFCSFSNGQSKYFVYLQTEPAQPFYIKINNQNISANTSGYLILPQLKDGDYKLTVGFPQNKYPEQTFDFKIDSKDKGYLIKNFGNEGWGLFDLQTMSVQKPVSASENAIAVKDEKKEAVPAENVSDFTKVLSKAANDPSLLEKPKPEPVVVEPPKPEPVPEKVVVKETPVVKEQPKEEVVVAQKEKPAETKVAEAPKESAKTITEEKNTIVEKPVEKPVEEVVVMVKEESKKVVAEEKAANNAVNESESMTPVASKRSDVSQVSSTVSPQGVTMVYNDKDENGNDEQITIFIPEPKKVYSNVEQPKAAKEIPEIVNPPVEKPAKFEVKEMPPVEQKQENTDGPQIVIKTNSDCNAIANEDDFLKLRRRMANRDNDDQMISEAEKAYKSKCYTTAQIKYLSSMFLSNAGKFNFYKASLPHVSDADNFSSLRSEIKDDYYLGKFDALIGK
ncbi:MAG TPA: DUF4476 domain-containing protein [Niabella sp.]|nr:DUF4476 domain-containing protein [Niabella sp.]